MELIDYLDEESTDLFRKLEKSIALATKSKSLQNELIHTRDLIVASFGEKVFSKKTKFIEAFSMFILTLGFFGPAIFASFFLYYWWVIGIFILEMMVFYLLKISNFFKNEILDMKLIFINGHIKKLFKELLA